MCGVFGVSLPPGSGTEAAAVAVDRPVRPPAPRPGIGRHRGQRRRRDLPVQGPRDDRPGPRRPAAARLPRRPRDRPLPLLDDRLDDLGERPADVPARAAAVGRDRAQRQPREHPRAPRPARGRPRPPRRDDGHGAPDDAPRRRAGGRHGRGAAAASCRASAAPTRCSSSTRAGSSASATRTASGRSCSGGIPDVATGASDAAPWALEGAQRRLGPVVRDDRAWTSSAPSSCATSSRARWSSSSPAASRAPSDSRPPIPALCVFEMIYFARPDSYMEGRNLYEVRRRMGEQLARRASRRRGPRDARAGHRRPGRGGLRGGERHAVPRGPRPQPVHGPDVHPAVADDAPPRRDAEAQPAARGRAREAADRRRRLDRARHDDASRSSPSSARPAPRRSTSGSARRRSSTRASTASTRRSRPSSSPRRSRSTEIRDFIGADSLGYLSIQGVLAALDLPYDRFCFACFDGRYPEPVPYDASSRKFMLEEAVPARG